MMRYFSRHVTHLLTAYVHAELPAHQRRRVTRHVQTCDACYAALRREEELTRRLAADLPGFGAPDEARLRQLWPGIMAEVAPDRRRSYRKPAFALVLVTSFVLAMVIPAAVMPRAFADRTLDQPSPITADVTPAHSPTDSAGIVLVGQPTAVAHLPNAATETPDLDPLPAPIAMAQSAR